jgi:hypothetical protein
MHSPGRRWLILLLSLLLFAANYWACARLFRTHYTVHMGSIEGAYIGLSRYILEHWGELEWFPLWYGGIPYANTYPPFLHWMVAGVAKLLLIDPALAHHAVTAFFYCLGPVALFWLALRLGNWIPGAFFAGMLHTAISLAALMMPEVRGDIGGLWHGRRLHTLVYYGEGPHITALALLPLAILLLDRVVERKSAMGAALACAAMGAVALTNWLGAFSLAAAALCYAVARWSPGSAGQPPQSFWKHALFLAFLGALAYGLAGPWLPPSTISAIRTNAATIEGDFRLVYASMPRYAALLLLAFAVLKVFFRRWGVRWQFQFAGFLALLLGAIPLADSWFGIAMVPQPHRYHLEMEWAVCLAVGLMAGAGLGSLRRRRAAVVMAMALVLVIPLRSTREWARGLIQPLDIRTRIEYRMARWIDQNLGPQRVAVPGATQFWFLAFADTPQIGGGFEQGVSNPAIRIISYLLVSGETPGFDARDTTLLWLKAFGVQAVGAGGPQTAEWYRAFAKPERFAGLEELWREGDDAVYRVPQRSASLARVVRRRHLATRLPNSTVDLEPLWRYVAGLEDPSLPEAHFEWLSPQEARITGKLNPDHLISVQQTYHSGWRAFSGGQELPLAADGLGWMVIEPGCNGPCTVTLRFDGGRERTLLRLGHAAAWGVLVLWMWRDRRRMLS